MSLITGGRLDRRGFLKSTAAGAIAASLPMGGALAQTPKRGGHLIAAMGHGSTSDTLDPAILDNAYSQAVAFAVHGRLTEVAPDGSLAPELAESWEATPDAKQWRFKLRKGVTFHSGRAVTLEDVVNSINYHRGEDSTSAAGPIVAGIADIATEGDDTLIFTLSGGNADFPFILSDYHLVICPADGDGIDWRSADGCGSYTLKDFKPGIITQLERNPNHWREGVGWFDSADLLSITDQNARTTSLVAGDVHVADKVDLKAAALLARKPGIKVESVAGTQHYTFAMDTRADPFTDNNIRQALKYGINRPELVEKILFGYGSVGNDHPIGPNQRYFNTELEQKTYDPDKARWFLKEAGVDSVSVSLSASEAAFASAVDAATLYQNSAKAAGIDINVVREPRDGYWSDVWMKKPFSAVYWGGRPVEDQSFAIAYACGGSWNDTFWCNETFEDLMVKARAELDEDKRRQMYWEMQDILSNQGGVIIPMFASYVTGLTENLTHPEKVASNWDLDGLRFVERWWFA